MGESATAALWEESATAALWVESATAAVWGESATAALWGESATAALRGESATAALRGSQLQRPCGGSQMLKSGQQAGGAEMPLGSISELLNRLGRGGVITGLWVTLLRNGLTCLHYMFMMTS